MGGGMCGIPQVLPLGGPPPCVSQPCTEHTHLPEEGTRGPTLLVGQRPARAGGAGYGGCRRTCAGAASPPPPEFPGAAPPSPPARCPSHRKRLLSSPAPAQKALPFLLFPGSQPTGYLHINMFVTDAKIYTFFCLIKMFKLELAYCLWISRFC